MSVTIKETYTDFQSSPRNLNTTNHNNNTRQRNSPSSYRQIKLNNLKLPPGKSNNRKENNNNNNNRLTLENKEVKNIDDKVDDNLNVMEKTDDYDEMYRAESKQQNLTPRYNTYRSLSLPML